MSELKNLLGGYVLEDVQSYKDLAVVPVRLEKKSGIEYILFSEALDKNLIDIIETGVVNKLGIRKQTEKDVLVIKGEYVVGGKQNRVVSVNGLIGKKDIDLPVHCIQHGRWSSGINIEPRPRRPREPYPYPRTPRRPRYPDEPIYYDPIPPWEYPYSWDDRETRPRRFGYDEERTGSGFNAGQSLFSSSIRASISKNGSRGGEQSKTWNSINYLSSSVGAHSATQDFDEIFYQKKEDVDDYLKNFSYKGENGVIANTGDIFYVDLFDKPETFEKQYKKILSSYIIDALATKRKGGITKDSAKKFLEETLSAKADVSSSLDLGEDYEIRNRINGSALVYKDTILYLGAKG